MQVFIKTLLVVFTNLLPSVDYDPYVEYSDIPNKNNL